MDNWTKAQIASQEEIVRAAEDAEQKALSRAADAERQGARSRAAQEREEARRQKQFAVEARNRIQGYRDNWK